MPFECLLVRPPTQLSNAHVSTAPRPNENPSRKPMSQPFAASPVRQTSALSEGCVHTSLPPPLRPVLSPDVTYPTPYTLALATASPSIIPDLLPTHPRHTTPPNAKQTFGNRSSPPTSALQQQQQQQQHTPPRETLVSLTADFSVRSSAPPASSPPHHQEQLGSS
eukprot:CAMPEP_0198731402 /NCGR_PEP_ID=MMETSP1475-20131203/29541_1 /TAXON_ID= ORGANISM="Unidentified sp., Strain CCMP1999" /NCGR_SAMPLE_ID=MMETSP1475 /ASSEMBLY_ACC=CAM_ASM_001111 /LENGTH=164 /DNA_ID=CAMNT_0044494361 /DNA_START=310 /DNA_END=802 /DNA_ORIENTATION=+